MKKKASNKIITYLLALSLSLSLSGCNEKSDCEIPSRHVHKYTKQVTEDLSIESYFDNEHLSFNGYDWNKEYVEINEKDEKIYKLLNKNKLFKGTDNWTYLYNIMATHQDYLMFYYEYETVGIEWVFNSKGGGYARNVIETEDGWTDNPNYIHNTGSTLLYHPRYYGYRIIYKDGKYDLERSKAVDDIREIIEEYPYFSENCIEEITAEFEFAPEELPFISIDSINPFTGPDLSNKNLFPIKDKTKRTNY